MSFVITIIAFLFVFSLIVFVHELGHFTAARRVGVKVLEFAFGFPPRIWSKKRKGTTYAINAIPLGGYVKLQGEDSESSEPDSYSVMPAWRRILILVSGVLMNFVLAWLIFFAAYSFGVKPIIPQMADHEGVINNLSVTISEIEKDTPAYKEGIKKGDIIRKADGQEINLSEELILMLQNKENDNSVDVILERDGKTIEKKITTYKSKIKSGDEEIEVNRIGVVLEDKGNIRAPFYKAIWISAVEVWDVTRLTFEGLVELFGKLFSRLEITENATGPVGMFIITGSYAQQGFSSLIQLAALLSIAVGAFNIIPVPGLDGGHILVVLLESIFRRTFSNKAKNIIQLAGFGALMLLVLVITFKDLFRFGII